MSVIHPARVREIVALDEHPALRNLLITDAYHRLAVTMEELIPGGDLAWPTFAIWASKQAGVFIRREELPATAQMLLDRLDPEHRSLVQAMLDGTSRYIAGGNLIVFDELGLAFASFIETFAQPSERTEANLAALVGRFSKGEPVPDEVTLGSDGKLTRKAMGGQSMIREALCHFFQALHETDEDARAELLLLANGECGLHEQIRLQPYIQNALNAPAEELLRMARLGAHPHAEIIVEASRHIATELMMTMALPHEIIDLGSDLEAAPGSEMWPTELARLHHPGLVALTERLHTYETRERELDFGDRAEGWFNTLMAKIDLAHPEAQGTAAKDWSRLEDRMRFIFEFFRSRQRDTILLTSPFSPEAYEEMYAGRMPRGPL